MGSAMSRCVGRRIVGNDAAESSDDDGEKVTIQQPPPTKRVAQQSATISTNNNRLLVNRRQHNLSKIGPFSSSSNWVRKSIIRRKKSANSNNISEENSTNNEQERLQYSINNNDRNLNTLIDDRLTEENSNRKNRINNDTNIGQGELMKTDVIQRRTWKKYIPFGSKLFGHDRNDDLPNEGPTAASRAPPSSTTIQQHKYKSHAGATATDPESLGKEALRLAYQPGSSIERSDDLQAAIAYGAATMDDEELQQQQMMLHQRQQNFRLHTDVLYKNFQDRLANTQEQSAKPNLKMTQSQIEFFRMLDEKIAQGSSFDRDSFS